MKLHLGFEIEYKSPDVFSLNLQTLLSDTGKQDHSIFLDKETLILFAVQKISANFDCLPNHPNVKRLGLYSEYHGN